MVPVCVRLRECPLCLLSAINPQVAARAFSASKLCHALVRRRRSPRFITNIRGRFIISLGPTTRTKERIKCLQSRCTTVILLNCSVLARTIPACGLRKKMQIRFPIHTPTTSTISQSAKRDQLLDTLFSPSTTPKFASVTHLLLPRLYRALLINVRLRDRYRCECSLISAITSAGVRAWKT
jgi:hypothetical protein